MIRLRQALAARPLDDAEIDDATAAMTRAVREAEKLSGLTSTDHQSTITPPMNATASSTELAKGISRSQSRRHPFVKALYEHPDPKKRMTVAQWAEAHKQEPGTVASWYAKPKADSKAKRAGGRRIPIAFAQQIEKEYGVPATVAVWRNGIKTD